MFREIFPEVGNLTPEGVRACMRACVLIPVNSLGKMEPVPWLKVASDKLKKPDNRS